MNTPKPWRLEARDNGTRVWALFYEYRGAAMAAFDVSVKAIAAGRAVPHRLVVLGPDSRRGA